MTDYTDVPQASGLHQSRQNVTAAITLIDGGGIINNFSVAPQPTTGVPVTNVGGAINILVPDASAELMTAARDWLVQRQADLDGQLAALGVTNPPPQSPPTTTRGTHHD
jgi:hypothetical protein